MSVPILPLTVDPSTAPQHPDQPLRLQLWLALSLVPHIAGFLDEPAERGILVADATACWLALPTPVTTRYQQAARGGISALELFAWDYQFQAEAAATALLPDPATVPTHADDEEVLRQAWRTFVDTTGHRLPAGTPPAPDWLRQFPGQAVNLSAHLAPRRDTTADDPPPGRTA